MSKIKNHLKHWSQGKMKSLNVPLVERFTYVCRAEYLTHSVLNNNETGISNENYFDNEIIVSLTTYEKRLYNVYLTIESIMLQTLKPNRIILWLGDELKNVSIPLTLRKQQKRGLEIRYCNDIRSYKKLIPVLSSFPSATIITIDDDYLYHFDLIENFINAHKNEPELILCTRMHRIKLLNNNTPDKYSKWLRNCNFSDISPLNFPIGAGGILYPPNSLNKEVFNESTFLNICKFADDVWFKAMALLNNTLSKKIITHITESTEHLLIEDNQDTSLTQINVNKKMNDKQLKSVFDKYDLYKRLNDRL